MFPVREVISWVADLAYPSTCASADCRSFTDDSGPLCRRCDAKLRDLALAPACLHCAKPLAYPDAPCARCLGKGIQPYQSIVHLGTFAEPVKSLIHQIKYHRRWPLADWMADRLLEQPRVQRLLPQIDAVLAVPLYPARHRQRGYNQAALIATRISRKTGVQVIKPLTRVRDTESQTHLSHRARLANVRGAFELRRRAQRQISGRRILVVDDVITTGATLHAVGRTLQAADPTEVYAAVLAVADPGHRDFQAI